MSSMPLHALSQLAALATMMLIAGCTTPTTERAMDVDATVFVIVRHAEKSADDPKDPTLSPAGRLRAQRLADRLATRRVTAVHATAYRRTRQTAAPTAQRHGLDVQTYDASAPVEDFVSTLQNRPSAGTVLIIGHSNTVPAIAQALCACAIAPLREDEYDRWIAVRIDRNGAVTLEDSRY